MAHPRAAAPPIGSPGATNPRGSADPEPARAALPPSHGCADLEPPEPATRTPLGYEEPILPQAAAWPLRGSVLLDRSSVCWQRDGQGLRTGCRFVARSRIWLIRRAGSAGLQTGWPPHWRPTVAEAWIRHARRCRPCWRRCSGCRSADCSHGLHERCRPRRRDRGDLGPLRSRRCQLRSPGCRSPRICRRTVGCPHLDGRPCRHPAYRPRQRCRASRPRQTRRASRPRQTRRASRPRQTRRASRPRQTRRAYRPRRPRRRWPRGQVTRLPASIRCSLPARLARPWRRQIPARASGPLGGPSIRRPVARARSRPPPTPTLARRRLDGNAAGMSNTP